MNSTSYFDLTEAGAADARLAAYAEMKDSALGDALLLDMQGFLGGGRAPRQTDSARLTRFTGAVDSRFAQLEADYRHRIHDDGSRSEDIPLRAMRFMQAECFRRWVETMGQASTGSPQEDAQAFVAALTAFSHHLRWSAYSGEAVSALHWKAIHTVYARASGAGSAANSSAAPTQVDALYARLLLVGSLNTGAFSARQVDRISRWFAEWQGKRGVVFAMDPTLDTRRHYYCVDLGGERGVVRVDGAPAMTAPRYLRADGLLSAIAGERADLFLEAAQTTIGDYGDNPLFEFSEALDNMHRFWTYVNVRANARGLVREGAGVARADSLVGFGELARWAMDGANFEPPPGESWSVADRSVSGYGLTAPLPSNQDIGKGSLVGIHETDAPHWKLAHVVRVQVLADRKSVSVGVQRLGDTAYPIRLISPDVPVLAEDPADDPNIAFYVVGDPAKGLADSLIIGHGRFNPKGNFSILTEKAMYQIRMNRVIQHGEDWERVGFEVFARVLP